MHELNVDEENVFGTTLFRSEEDPRAVSSLEEYMELYIKLDIKKFFNLSIAEYLDSTEYFKNVVNDVAIDNIKRIQEEYEKMNNDTIGHDVMNNEDNPLSSIFQM